MQPLIVAKQIKHNAQISVCKARVCIFTESKNHTLIVCRKALFDLFGKISIPEYFGKYKYFDIIVSIIVRVT